MEKIIYSGRVYTVEVSESDIKVMQGDRELCYLTPATLVGTVTESDGKFTDNPDTDERLIEFVCVSESEFRWEAESSNWRKTYTLQCDEEGFSFFTTLHGSGNIGEVRYFTNNPKKGSIYRFCEYFMPNAPSHADVYTRRLASLSFESFFELLIPPPYVYSFRTEALDGRFGLGLVAKEGEYNFVHFNYYSHDKMDGFCLYTNLEGHTSVDGEYTLPYIRSFFGENDIDVIKKYSNYHYDTGLCRTKDRSNMPRWWRGPIVCGWNEQMSQKLDFYPDKEQNALACQEVYEKIADMIEEHGIRPTMLIIDDRWQKGYGDCLPDPEKWPDMRAFTDKMHARGIRVLLWFRMWGGHGLPEDETMPGEGMPYHNGLIRLNQPPYSDPTNKKYQERLKKNIHYLLSDEEGCMNCDGFKLDYTLVQPYGKTAKSAGGQYGAEATKILYNIIYNTSKEVKPDALINASPCHPYFNEVCDQARLHDYEWCFCNETERMSERAELFRAVMPDVLIDTDSTNLSNRDDGMRYYRNMPSIGVPDIYQFTKTPFTEEDWREIEKIFNDYSDKMDELYGKA